MQHLMTHQVRLSVIVVEQGDMCYLCHDTGSCRDDLIYVWMNEISIDIQLSRGNI